MAPKFFCLFFSGRTTGRKMLSDSPIRVSIRVWGVDGDASSGPNTSCPTYLRHIRYV